MTNLISFFAYGELMNEDYFKSLGLEYHEKVTVTLSAYRLIFNKIPVDNKGIENLGLSNIEPTPSGTGMMEGVMYEMDEKFLPQLDEILGYPNEYQRKVFKFNRHDFTQTNGFTYLAHPERIRKGLKPSKESMKLLKGARKNLSMLYFSRMVTTPTCD